MALMGEMICCLNSASDVEEFLAFLLVNIGLLKYFFLKIRTENGACLICQQIQYNTIHKIPQTPFLKFHIYYKYLLSIL